MANENRLQKLLSENEANKSEINKIKENLKIFAADKALLFSSDLILFRMGKRHQPKTFANHCNEALKSNNAEIAAKYIKILQELDCLDGQITAATDGFDAMIRSSNSLAHPTPTVYQLCARIQEAKKILEILGTKETHANPDLYYACWVLENYKQLLPCLSELPHAIQ